MVKDSETLKVLAPWIAIGVTIIVLYIQIKRSRFSQSVDLILKLDQRFFTSDDMIQARRKAANALKSPSSVSSDIDGVLDFFETIGLLVRRKALDEEMVWHTFYYWLHRYWLLSKDYIATRRETTQRTWEDVLYLETTMTSMELRKSKTRKDIDISEDALKEFLNDECTLPDKTARSV